MASSKTYFARSSYRFLSEHNRVDTSVQVRAGTMVELDESDIWTTASETPEFRNQMRSQYSRKYSSPARREKISGGGSPASLPVNVPDWSKILKEEYSVNRRSNSDEDDEFSDDDELYDSGDRIPPHEFLARTRIASFSVHEGIGRTLKGRDLSRVRNAIWEKTGYQD